MGEGGQMVAGRRVAEKITTRDANSIAALKDRRLNQGIWRATANAKARVEIDGATARGNGKPRPLD